MLADAVVFVGAMPGFFTTSPFTLASCEAVGCVNPPCIFAGFFAGSAAALEATLVDDEAATLPGFTGAAGALPRGLPSALVLGGSMLLLGCALEVFFVAAVLLDEG